MANEEEIKLPATQENNLPTKEVGIAGLNQQSLALLNQIIAESDQDKVKDLTYLFNQNQNKKTLARIDSLSNLQDILTSTFSKRMLEHPDEISNQELMNGLKIIQELLERSKASLNDEQSAPLIQINKQTNSVNIGNEELTSMPRASRDKVKNFLTSIISAAERQAESVDTDTITAEPSSFSVVDNEDDD